LRSQGFEGHILFPSIRRGFQNRTLRLRYGIVNTIVAAIVVIRRIAISALLTKTKESAVFVAWGNVVV
jgi:hypothetical protein